MTVGKLKVDGNDLFNKIIWLMIVGILTFTAKKMDTMSTDISSLNVKMVTIVSVQSQYQAQQNMYQEQIRDHEMRMRVLEKSK
jgi:hypothetical protein